MISEYQPARLLFILVLATIAATAILLADAQTRAQNTSIITLSVTSGSPYIDEDGGSVTITATLDAPAPETVGVGIGHNGSANNADDYRTLTPYFIKGQQTATFRIIAKQDEIDEPNEIIELSAFLTFPDSEISAATQTRLHLVIVDDDGDPPTSQTPSYVTLTADDYNPDEGDTVTITATLDHPAGEDGVEVTISASDHSTASSGDYTLPTSPIAIAENATSGTATVTIADDSVDDDNEILVLDATATDITANGTTLIIADNDETPLSDVATLFALALTNAADSSNVPLTPTFDADTTSYSANVDANVNQITITPTTTHTGANVIISGNTVSSGSPSNAIDIAYGSNVIFVVVTAEDENTQKAYSIDVNRSFPQAVTPILNFSPSTSTPTTITLTVDPRQHTEGSSVIVTATLDARAPANGITITLNVNTSTSTADNNDYTLASDTINIAEDTTSGTATITFNDDTQSEPTETIFINATSTNPSLNSNTIEIRIVDKVSARPPNNALILRVEPAFRNVTLFAGDKVALEVHVYGRQNVRDASLADDLNLEWDDEATGTFQRVEGLNALYYTPRQPGTYTVTASLPEPERNCYAFRDDKEKCEAKFNIIARRPPNSPEPEQPPINPDGKIPETITDAQGVNYKVFTPVEGGTYTRENVTFSVPPSAVPDKEIIGINITKDEPASDTETVQRNQYKLAGHWHRVNATDSAGLPLSAYRLEKPAKTCLPLPDELRTQITNVSIAQDEQGDGNLTILTSNLIITIDGPIVCATTSLLPINAAVAVTAEHAPQLPPAPIFQTSHEALPETGGLQPPHPTILLLVIILTLTALVTTFTIARRRPLPLSAKHTHCPPHR